MEWKVMYIFCPVLHRETEMNLDRHRVTDRWKNESKDLKRKKYLQNKNKSRKQKQVNLGGKNITRKKKWRRKQRAKRETNWKKERKKERKSKKQDKKDKER